MVGELELVSIQKSAVVKIKAAPVSLFQWHLTVGLGQEENIFILDHDRFRDAARNRGSALRKHPVLAMRVQLFIPIFAGRKGGRFFRRKRSWP